MSTAENLPPEERLCRLCLTEDDLLCSIFAEDQPSASGLPEKIFECTSIQIENVPGVPCHLCEVCKSKLVICSQFVKQCRKTDEKIRRLYASRFELHSRSEEEVAGKEDNQIELIGYFEEEPEPETVGDGKQRYLIQVIEEDDVLEESQNGEKTIEIEIPSVENLKDFVPREQEIEIEMEPQVMYESLNNTQESEAVEVIFEKENLINQPEQKMKNVDEFGNPTIKAKTSRSKRNKSECPICGTFQNNLKQHMAVHTGIKKHVCKYCDKAFAQRGNLTIHMNIHTKKTPYKCTQCEKSFGDPTALKMHKVVHTSEFKYLCDICDSTFKYPHSLATHMRSHNNERRFRCNVCDKAFITSNVLKKHLRTHTGERPSKCERCSKTFASAWNLKTHMKSHDSNKSFQCDLCKACFGHKSNLKKHMEVHAKQSKLSK